jgi:hypothetical protein
MCRNDKTPETNLQENYYQMTSLSLMLLMYVGAILVAKRRQRITPGAYLLIIFLAIVQTVIIVIDMYLRKPPDQHF